MSLETLLVRLKDEARIAERDAVTPVTSERTAASQPLRPDLPGPEFAARLSAEDLADLEACTVMSVLATLQEDGITLSIDGDKLVARPRSAVTDGLCTLIRDNKAAILAELSRDWSSMSTADLLRAAKNFGMRISVGDNGDGRMVLYDVESGGPAGLWDEIGSRSGEILAAVSEEEVDIAAIVARIEAVCEQTVIADDLDTPIYKALPGVSPEFVARLDAKDRADIAAGDIPAEQVEAFEAAAIAREVEFLKVILEHDASLPRPDAELEAARLAVAYARNNGYLWSSLRMALADYPVLVPDRPGKVDCLLLGVSTSDGTAASCGRASQ